MRLRRHDAPFLGAGPARRRASSALPGRSWSTSAGRGSSISADRSWSTSARPLSSRTDCVSPGTRAALPSGDCRAGQAWSRAERDRAPRRRRAGNGGMAAMSLPAPVHRMPLPPAGPEVGDVCPLERPPAPPPCAVVGAVLPNIGRPAGECASSQADGDVRARRPGGQTPAEPLLLAIRLARAWIR